MTASETFFGKEKMHTQQNHITPITPKDDVPDIQETPINTSNT